MYLPYKQNGVDFGVTNGFPFDNDNIAPYSAILSPLKKNN